MARIFFDTEFIEDGKTIELLSIGMVKESGEHYYAVVYDADWERARANPWIAANVIPVLSFRDSIPYKSRAQIAKDIVQFAGDSPEFWADYAAYDWVALCQIFGTMMDLPKGWPMFCHDVQQLRGLTTCPNPPRHANLQPEHNALLDAEDCCKRWYEFSHKLRMFMGYSLDTLDPDR